MFYPASFHRQLDLAAAVVVESVSESATAAEQKDNPQAGIASESRRRFTSTSTVCCT